MRETSKTSERANFRTMPGDSSPSPNQTSTDRDHAACDIRAVPVSVSGSLRSGQASFLLILAASLDDLEGARIATGNRLFAFEDKGQAGTPEAERLQRTVQVLLELEKEATKDLVRAMRAHPLGLWAKQIPGVGDKQFARLLAALGDVAARENPGKLLQYAGHGDPARSRQCADNVRIEIDEDGKKYSIMPFSPTAKMRTRMIAETCVKLDGVSDKNGRRRARSPYRDVYDREKAKWADRDTSDVHKHNHALRIVGKRILIDLWREAKRISL